MHFYFYLCFALNIKFLTNQIIFKNAQNSSLTNYTKIIDNSQELLQQFKLFTLIYLKEKNKIFYVFKIKHITKLCKYYFCLIIFAQLCYIIFAKKMQFCVIFYQNMAILLRIILIFWFFTKKSSEHFREKSTKFIPCFFWH